MNKANLKSFIHGSAASMIGVGTLGVMNYFIRRILALNLPTIDYGFFYSAYAMITLVMVFLDLGIGQSVTILMSKSFAEDDLEQANKVFTLSFIVKTLLSLAAFLIMEAAAPYLTSNYFEYPGSYLLLMLIFLLIPVQVIENSFLWAFTARKAFVAHNILINIRTFIMLTGVFLYTKTCGIQSAALCFIVPSIIITIVSYIAVQRYGVTLLSFKKINFAELKNIFALSSWIAVSTAAVSIMYSMDTICLTWLRGLESVAMYNIALPIMQIALIFLIFPAIFTPFVSEMWQKKDYAGIRRTCIIGSLLMLLTLPVFFFAGMYFAPDIITIMFDKKFIAAAPAVTVLCCGMVFFSIASFNITALNSGGMQKNVAYMTSVCVFINLILNIVLIPKFNFTGAALATAITYVIMANGSILLLISNISKKIKNA